MSPLATPQVLRGMPLATAPVRLEARTAQAAPAPAAQPSPQAREEEQLRRAREQALREAREQGLRSGHEEGLRQGRAAAAEETRAAVEQAVAQALQPLQAEHERVRQLARSVQAALDGVLAAAQDEMIALCFETLCRMLGAGAVQPEAVRSQLAHVLARYGRREGLVLHLHPQDAQRLAGEPAGLQDLPPWTADPQVALGGCILRSPSGGLDARLETMLAACRSALLDARAQLARSRGAAGGAA